MTGDEHPTSIRKRGRRVADTSVLIIEDDAALRRGLYDNFAKRGYEVRTADNGSSGLKAVLAERADVILLDIMMPEMNGYEVCRQIRTRKIDSHIIMLTAKGQEDDIVRGLELGADDYVTKPFSVRELVARVEAFVRRSKQTDTQQYSFGPFVLDLAAHKLFRDEAEVELTTKEFRLLEYFVKREGRALTRNDILAAVWGSNVIVTARSVDRCVTTLRGKIETNPRQPKFVRTIRDVGYRFES